MSQKNGPTCQLSENNIKSTICYSDDRIYSTWCSFCLVQPSLNDRHHHHHNNNNHNHNHRSTPPHHNNNCQSFLDLSSPALIREILPRMLNMSTIQQLKERVSAEIDKKSAMLHDLSKAIWSNPELCFEERFAHNALTECLEKEGFSVEKHTPLETSFIARSELREGPTIGFLCEYDALPGIGHGCGHNLIAEVGVAAGLGVLSALKENPELKGKVVVYGTPAEEGGGGKVFMIKKGSFDGTDLCMMAHPAQGDVPLEDPIMLSCESTEIIFSGKAAHAAASPWEGINALDAAVACYNNISMMRQQMKPSWKVHGIFTDGGEKPNIIPRRAALNYLVRAPTDAERGLLMQQVINCAEGAAKSTGCSVEFRTDVPYSNLMSNLNLRKAYAKNLDSTAYQKNTMNPDVRGSTDAGNLSYVKPIIHPVFAIPADAMLHSESFAQAAGNPKAQQPTLEVAKALAMTAIDVICDPALLKAVKEEFDNRKLV